ncbi:methylated-DNA--[protein]-cysteine S-methyltransferase [Photobacterium carnosum]|uniref:methylated-DNA--[protein]-cysteine S-methyltransferase n=1 Tax=Photobacterium carnosum TaxID=2023717 RepID=UPI001E57B3F5|nr:methylated-DNA--[protein]-cysteine S-methyltransferase [Photobacterium carnosum]MCD9528087.1 methylated-DNA--[protein]-cysteine S-methyltransferase [Photobacterium carnosum]MCD9545808.1 methylated-DNA--[protein]-cysteine S-methyltransferase [Photobacterium carnosum]
MSNYYHTIETPLGSLTLYASDEALTAILYQHQTPQPETATYMPQHPLLIECERQLQQYFAGTRQQFNLPLAPKGTDFQQRVWQSLSTIPYGVCWSYQQLAISIGNIKACQAVGMANSKNPLSIVIPCHRVIGKNGKLTGYAGGLDKKQTLLALEQEHA